MITKDISYKKLPVVPFPLIKPVENGYYLIHIDTPRKLWLIAEWRDVYPNNPKGGWQGLYSVDRYIPFPLKESK